MLIIYHRLNNLFGVLSYFYFLVLYLLNFLFWLLIFFGLVQSFDSFKIDAVNHLKINIFCLKKKWKGIREI